MRELQVLGNGHLKLDFVDWKEFFETEMAEQLRSQLKSMIEQALEAERDYYLQLNYYEHAPQPRLDYRNGTSSGTSSPSSVTWPGCAFRARAKASARKFCRAISAAKPRSVN